MKRSGALARIAGVSILSLLAAGCAADSQRFAGFGGADNIKTGSLPPADVPAGSAAPSYGGGSYGGAASSGSYGGSYGGGASVQTSSLPPPKAAPQQSQYQGAQAGFAGVRPDAMSGSATGWTASGGAPVSVGQGDTVQSVADRYGVPPAAIRSANNLSGNGLTPGSNIIIPVYNPGASAAASVNAAGHAGAQAVSRPVSQAMAPVRPAAPATGQPMQTVRNGPQGLPAKTGANDRTAQVIAASRAAVQPPARPGEPPRSLQAQAQAQAQAPAQAKAQAKPLTQPQAQALAQAKNGGKPLTAQQLQQQAKAQAVAVPPAKQAVAQVQPKAPVEEKKAPVRQQVAVAAPVAAPEAPAAKQESETNSGGAFRWPARGRIIQGFNGRSGNEGINIAVPEGTPVKAAEGGVVAYSGSELKGYGNLVLIRHDNGWVSAYANNGELMVKRGEKVSRGQTVAKSGQSGNVSTPQLHFELRKGSTPVDPMPHLAGG